MKWHKVCRGAVMAGVLGLGVMQPYYDQSPMMSVAEAKEQLNCENTRQGIEAYYNMNFEQALDSLNKALEAGEDTQADAYYARGLVYYQLGKYDLALDDLQKSLCSRRAKFAKLRRSKSANSGRLKFANLSQSKRANHKISTAQIGCSGMVSGSMDCSAWWKRSALHAACSSLDACHGSSHHGR